MKYSSKSYEFLFDKPCDGIEGARELLKHKSFSLYRTVTVKAGDMFEVMIYPLWDTRADVRKAKKAASREAQKNLNDINTFN
jgi:hypothetical protein